MLNMCFFHVRVVDVQAWLRSCAAQENLLTSSSRCQQLRAALSRYKDFEKGVDTVETAGDRTLVDGRLQSIGITSQSFLACCPALSLRFGVSHDAQGSSCRSL